MRYDTGDDLALYVRVWKWFDAGAAYGPRVHRLIARARGTGFLPRCTWRPQDTHGTRQRAIGEQFRLAQRQFQHTQEQFTATQAKDREQAELTREGQVTRRYAEAIKPLNSGPRVGR